MHAISYPTYNEDPTIYHQTALAYIAAALQEMFCPKPQHELPQEQEQEQQHQEDQPPHIEIDIHTEQQEDYLLLDAPKTQSPINLNQSTSLQIICNCLAKYFKKPKQKY